MGSRYRVVGLLGRGGMGEVYRADDLELNQAVALKFLPEQVVRSQADLQRLRQEVRIARQVAHPNVCRTYDIAEADGQVFVVMEYVDGEDLASVLRRLGRPTPEKAVEIARQICLGLGAAHESGVLHRDLKPANIMIDGRGRVRITDFGLAGTAEEIAARGAVEGTPAYMAPEALKSGTATVQSDIYALGLVLYEIFTGKRAADLARKVAADADHDSGVRTPSSVVTGIDPAVERIILQCLNQSPARRPASAYAVFAALPGGDPLAAAVAAGETPSPALVANAGVEGSLHPLWAGALVLVTLLGFYGKSVMDRPRLAGLDRSATYLGTKAEEILTRVTGARPPRYSWQGFRLAPGARDSIPAPGAGSVAPQVAPKQYWRRWSPAPLERSNFHDARVDPLDPAQIYPGSGTVVLDAAGSLRAFNTVPNPAAPPPPANAGDVEFVLRAAGRDPPTLTRVEPPAGSRSVADSTVAWRTTAARATGSSAETTFVATFAAGRVASFDTYAGRVSLGSLIVRIPQPWPGEIWWTFFFGALPLIGGVILARHNLKRGRVDLRGGLVAGCVVFVLVLAMYIFSRNIGELGIGYILGRIASAEPLGHAIFHAVITFVAYVAIEPYVRRFYPKVLVSWARLSSGRWRDPILGRDILLAAAFCTVLDLASELIDWLSRHGDIVSDAPLLGDTIVTNLGGAGYAITAMAYITMTWLARLTIGFLLVVIFRALLRNSTAAIAAFIVLITLLNLAGIHHGFWLALLLVGAFNTIFSIVGIRFGLLAAVLTATLNDIMDQLAWSTDTTAWYAPQTMLLWGLLLVLLTYGFVTATRGRAIIRDPLGGA